MTKPKAQVEYRKLTELKELTGNPRTIKKDQFEKLKRSIKDNQDYFEARPIILSDRTGELVILAGNHRQHQRQSKGNREEIQPATTPSQLQRNHALTIDEAHHIAKTTQSYTLRRDMFKFIKRKEREKWLQTKPQKTANASPHQ